MPNYGLGHYNLHRQIAASKLERRWGCSIRVFGVLVFLIGLAAWNIGG